MDAPHHRAPLASPASLGWLFVAVGVAAIAGGMASRQAPAEPINGNEALLAKIDGALAEMIKDGSLDTYSHKYFPFSIYPENWTDVSQ